MREIKHVNIFKVKLTCTTRVDAGGQREREVARDLARERNDIIE